MNDRALKLLEQYGLEVTSVRRARGAYLLETPQGLRILSDYSGSEHKAQFQNRVMRQIRESGYESVDLLLPNQEGELVVKDWEENRYVVKEWYAGRECDTANEQEILRAVCNLAQLHRVMYLAEEPEFEKSFTAQTVLEELRAQNAELKKIRSYVRKKNTKGDFERLFLNCFSVYFEQAEEAEHRLAEQAFAQMAVHGSVCHGDYDHHHVLMSAEGIATTNFENCRFDYQVNDFYRFLRKILEKHDWNQRLGQRMLEAYTRIRPLPKEERELLYVRMLYPEKFRKLANHYYSGNKAWISRRFLDKLELLNRQQGKRKEYVRMLEK